ncbi:hypothetical protein ACP_3024 [Acidobacterium capsulatum ATCC 51196]|uniref:Uncharacterized protein n=1 Tax=Acidobacterium capsulatum (strain ATCC 51196 / DSM 11244 / BCRC 80197 / JCM 7670 / NBRC 15755 / NCIMB 13165 / 161) TaxID=240015 RepID=C1F4I1_ACIC5|nr:hypothetical protein ACP_3024 [Acidobacterium capsulatum ATCC 51196]
MRELPEAAVTVPMTRVVAEAWSCHAAGSREAGAASREAGVMHRSVHIAAAIAVFEILCIPVFLRKCGSTAV